MTKTTIAAKRAVTANYESALEAFARAYARGGDHAAVAATRATAAGVCADAARAIAATRAIARRRSNGRKGKS